ncbi:hypothetical protein [Niveibacterium microcysteis]|uniref:Uncharacterized protein n=1 Tax=Niveibacterium microcysteis TaxID=2811415 RepID=A0ABX7MCS5_9RHOO|nr:hypothetical protein [Niveibacterium microcysteis]QSI78628.1 hypothetical protein JY500_08495 [Niveibacterium microcysteis]
MNKPSQFEALLGVVGVALSVTAFFAQGGGGSAVANLFAISPLLIAVMGIYVRRLVLRLRQVQGALALVTNARSDTSMVVTIENVQGDVEMEKRVRVEATRDGAGLAFTKNEVVFSEAPIHDIPPVAVLQTASNPKTTLHPRYVDTSEAVVGGSRNYRYDWRYAIAPPIQTKGHFVDFVYKVRIPRSEASAFTAAGSKIFYDHSAFETSAEVSLISPSGYRIEIAQTYLELNDGSREPCNVQPQLNAGGHVLHWKPEHRRGARSVCEYRLVASSVVASPPAAAGSAPTPTGTSSLTTSAPKADS